MFEIAFLSREQIDRFKSDFCVLADYLYQMRTDDSYVPSDYQIEHVREVLKLLEAVTEDKRFTENVDKFEKSKGVTMCKVLDEVEERGIDKGRKEGEQNATILINYLWENGRGEDASRAANDNDFFNKLLAELMPTLSTEK